MRVAKLGDVLAQRSRGIVPASTPDETFELYSVPAFEAKRPEVLEAALEQFRLIAGDRAKSDEA